MAQSKCHKMEKFRKGQKLWLFGKGNTWLRTVRAYISVPEKQVWCNCTDFCRTKRRLDSTEAEFGTGGWQHLPTSQHIFPPGLSQQQFYLILSCQIIKFSTYDFSVLRLSPFLPPPPLLWSLEIILKVQVLKMLNAMINFYSLRKSKMTYSNFTYSCKWH